MKLNLLLMSRRLRYYFKAGNNRLEQNVAIENELKENTLKDSTEFWMAEHNEKKDAE